MPAGDESESQEPARNETPIAGGWGSDVDHVPVLPKQVLDLLDPQPNDVVVDATLGLGGHAKLLGEQLGPEGVLIGLDMDPANLEGVRQRLDAANLQCRVELVHANFAELEEILASLDLSGVDVLLADLGISSTQLDDAARGLSFQREGPLDMRLDPRLKVTAATLINSLREQDLGDLLFQNAQEFKGRRIAKRICDARRDSRITTTRRLAQVIAEALGVDPESRKSKIHPATKTFMALRMAVNQEIRNLHALLESAPKVLRRGGRFGVIAFHSNEDKPVKLDFRKRKTEGIYTILTKKPLVADEEERRRNPRSRSAKLRVAVRV
jgi:16S rRNA (cytosine1402-N4)-methyltransferase